MKIHNVEVAYHRNGVSGIGFHVVTFTWKDTDVSPPVTRRMVATVFPKENTIAVLDIDQTAAGNIAFAKGNSWRGDHFEAELREEIAHYEGE